MAATNVYVRKTGSDNNGGSSTGASPDRTGTDGVTAGTTTFVAASGAFTSGDVDKWINIVTKGRYRITAFTNSTTVTLSGSPSAGTLLTWNLGGACLTVGAILGNANAALVNGDSIWIGAGTYRETITCANANTAEVTVNGDFDGAKTGDVGMVAISAYTTNDKTAPSGTTLLNLNGKDFLTFKNILFIGGAALIVTATTTTSTNIKFTDCGFIVDSQASIGCMSVTAAFSIALNWTIDRCVFLNGGGFVFTVTLTTGSGADWDANFVVQNCLFFGGKVCNPLGSGASAQKGGGVKMLNCTSIGCFQFMNVSNTGIATSVPCTVNNSLMLGIGNAGTPLIATTSGQITEDYNVIAAVTPRSNVTAGTHSKADGSYATLVHFGQERIWGALLRMVAEPMASSPLLGFGNDGNQTTYDLRNKIRPAGGASASPGVGAMERGNSFVTDASPIGGGGSAIKTTGPGYAEFLVPVPARAITIACTVKWDATYAGTKPQLQIDANGIIGVAAETITATGSSGSNETLTLSAFTPSAAGQMVTVRVISNDTNGGGLLQVDDFSVTG